MHRTLAHRLRTLASAGLLLLLSACMLVDDFSPAWDKGVTDSCTSKIRMRPTAVGACTASG